MSEKFTSSNCNPPSEGDHAIPKDRSRAHSVESRRRGRKRGPRSIGRYPLRETIGRYMRSVGAYLAETTSAERARKLRAIARRYEELCKADPALEKDPAKWTEKEVTAILVDMRKRGLSLGTQKKNLGHVNAVLRFVGNGVLSKMRAQMPHALPRGQYVKGPSLSEGEVEQILSSLEGFRGWRGEVARFVIAAYAYTGLRMSELRRAKFEDVDERTWTLRVRHPKGEGSYGEFRTVPIPGPLRPYLARFLRARERMLAGKGLLSVEPLIPKERGDPNSYYSANAFEAISSRARQVSGVDFDFRALRRTYGQNLLNRGVQLQSVSLMLGHSSTLTTEKYYCRQDASSARLEVLRAFEETSRGRIVNPPLIEEKSELTGYV